jgi:hypothetical protein
MKRAYASFISVIVVLLLVLALFRPTRLSAQAVAGIWGVVMDQSGAVVPGARITAVNGATGLSYFTVSTGTGNYVLTSLPIGTYTASAAHPGFKAGSVAGVALDVNQQREINFTLVVAGTAQEVTVSTSPPLINTANDTLGGVITGQQVEILPLNGRNIVQLITLSPGTANDINGAGVGKLAANSGYVTNNGNRGTMAVMYMDGSDISDVHFGGLTMTDFNLDAIAEFRVQQNNYSAEYGRGGGMVVQVASKAGTNAFHGSAFEFVRNSDLDSRSFYAPETEPLQRNEFGATIGGPIKKDKTFFFFEFAGFRQLSGVPTFYRFPTAQNRQGIVDITGANGQPDQLEVPLNAAASTLLSEYPLPNDPTGPYGASTFYDAVKAPLSSTQYSGRIDHRFSEKDSIFGRFTYLNSKTPVENAELILFNKAWAGVYSASTRNLMVGETHVFTPTLLNVVQLSWVRQIQGNLTPDTPVTSVATSDGSLAPYGPNSGGWTATPDTGILDDSIHWVKGRHSMSTGIEFRDTHEGETGSSFKADDGNYTFETGSPIPVAIPSASGLNNLPAGSPSPSGLVSVMLGDALNYYRALAFPGFGATGSAVYQMRTWDLNAYFQDDIAVTPKLKLNVGVRYEYDSVPTEEHNRMVGIVDDPHLEGGSVYRAWVLNPTPLYQPDYSGWGPRFGLAYRLDNKTVLRGGFGIYTFMPPVGTADQSPIAFPYSTYGAISNPPFQLTPLAIGNLPHLTDLAGNPMPPNNNTNLIPPNTPLNLGPAVAYFANTPLETNVVSMYHPNGYGINANATLERQLPGDMALSIAYVASNGVRIFGSEYPNAYTGALPQYTPYTNAYPGIGEFQLEDSHDHSTYNALQVVLRKTSAKHGLTFQASYSYSKELDNGDTVYNGPPSESSSVPQNPTCWSCEKAPGSISFPQNFVADFIYSLPFDSLPALSHLPRRLTQGWQIAAIPRLISGSVFTVESPYPIAEFGTDTYNGSTPTRPDMVGTATLNSKSNYASTLSFFTPNVDKDGATLGQQIFATPGGPSTGSQSGPGNLGRNTFRAPLQKNFDFSIFKDTKITEGKTIQFRAEFFNIFNLHYFTGVNEVLGETGFGLFTGTTPGRIIQFGARFIF